MKNKCEELNLSEDISNLVNLVLKKHSIWTYIEVGGFITYILLVLGYSYINEEGWFGVPFIQWVSLFFTILFSLIILLAVIAVKLSVTDYRFKVVFHGVVLGTLGTINGLSVPGLGLHTLFTDSPLPFEQILINFILQTFLAFPIAIATIFNLFYISDPYMKVFEKTRREIEKGNFSVQITEPFVVNDTVFGPFAILLNNVIGTAHALISEAKNTNQFLVKTSSELVTLAEELKNATEVVSSSTETLSNAANTQVDSISTIADEMNHLVTLINDVTGQITEHTELVSNIAQQTTILSLNAAIEAARAGEAGRGFGVVASHVRALAADSKNVSDKISQTANLISETLQQSFAKIKGNIEDFSSVAEESAASTEEIAATIQEITSNMQQLYSSAENLSRRANELKKILSKV